MARPQKPKYHLPRSRRKNGSGGWVWLLVLLFVVAGFWLWWTRHQTRAAAHRRAEPVPVVRNSPNVPPPVARIPPPVIPIKPPMEHAPERSVAETKTGQPVSGPQPEQLAPAAPTVNGYPRPVSNPFEAQVALARMAISPGSIDGANGSQTRLALRQFQWKNHLPETGSLNAQTRALLTLDGAPYTTYTVTASDLAHLQPLGRTWLEKSEQSALDYETEVELVGEYSHSNPALIRRLNPDVDWDNLAPGTTLQIPDVQYPDPPDKAAFVIIHLSGKYLEAFDQDTNLLAHFPCSIAAHVEKRPVGLLHVTVVAPNPNYTLDPAVFLDSPEVQKLGRKLILPAGPNNPVGVAWMGLDRPGYGMHGTPAPEQVGRTESHGCFRLANWDAAYLVKLVWVGMPVDVVP